MKKEKKKDNKKVKKIIVNGLTLSRVAGMFAMPILFNSLSAPVFIATIAAILLTDLLDGLLAKHVWHVSTIFGTYADMGADKLFGFAVLLALSTMYPVMYIPFLLEVGTLTINVLNSKSGANLSSSIMGKIKMGILGGAICSLFITGMAPELINSLSNIKVSDISNDVISNLVENFKSSMVSFVNFFKNNEKTLVPILETAAIASEALTTGGYTIKYIKNPDKGSKTYKISEYFKNKEYRDFIKKVLFDEKYHKETKDMPLGEKLTPPEYREEVKVKKLTLDNNKK